jgi:molecular chaperone GrpE (heat shock protein)
MTTENQDTQPAPALDQQLADAKAQAAENWDKFLRAAADLENYRKRVVREREELARGTREAVIAALLPALDNLERALEHSPADTPLHEGLLQVQKQFQRALADFGLTETIRPSTRRSAKLSLPTFLKARSWSNSTAPINSAIASCAPPVSPSARRRPPNE